MVSSLHVLSTIVHEAGHAAMSVVTGGGVHIIEIHSPHSGVTISWVPSWLPSVIRIAAGYAAPPLAGLGIAALLADGKVQSALILTVGCVVAVGLVAFATQQWGSTGLQQWIAYLEPGELARMTHLPGRP